MLAFRIVDATEALAQRNPNAPRGEIREAGRLIASLGEAVLSLPTERQRHLLDNKDELRAVIDRLAKAPDLAPPIDLAPQHSVERHRGKGLGQRVGSAEGAARLAGYAATSRLQDWAGPVAGAGELDAAYGIARSTLQDWRRCGAVIGLLKGTRKHVFPLAQFVDGRPVGGLALLRTIIRDPRTAWLWLVEPYDDGKTPLDRLKDGEIDAILEAARADFA